jgi:hypothetical protein
MRTRQLGSLVILAGLTLTAAVTRADQQKDHLKDLEKQAKKAKDRGDLGQVANYLCEAANLDAAHYGKRCERARADAEKKIQEFGGDLETGKAELRQRDFAGAIRDLSKIIFGPNQDEAQRLILQARASLPGPEFEAANQAIYRVAAAAYQRGDFETAATQASLVNSPATQPAAKQLLANIKVYQDTMARAALLAQNGDYKGAREAYAFAVKINANGPGSPADKLRDMDARVANQAAEAAAKSQQAAEAAEAAQKAENAAKVKVGLAKARRDEAKGDLKAALQDFERVLMVDGQHAEALAGKQRILTELRSDPEALVESLEDGIRSYYASQFEKAAESISGYLNSKSGELHYKGAAHFYLGASLLSEAIFADPHDQAHANSLRQSAEQQFEEARQEKYKPVESQVSPRILAAWTKNAASSDR